MAEAETRCCKSLRIVTHDYHIYITANVLHYRISWFRSIIVEMTYRQTDTVNLTLTLIPTQTFAMADRLPVYLPFHWSPIVSFPADPWPWYRKKTCRKRILCLFCSCQEAGVVMILCKCKMKSTFVKTRL